MRRLLIALLLIAGIVQAQKAADPTQRYFRLICLVHLTGTGTANDPVMPEKVAAGVAAAQAPVQATQQTGGDAQAHATNSQQPTPTPGGVPMSSRPGILAWSMLPTDDKSMAIIQVVATDRAALAPFLTDTRPEIRVFEIGKDSKQAIESEMRKYKADFDLTRFQVVAQ